MEPIAIIGIGCRFPDASSPHEFWLNQRNGHQSFGPVDPRRWDHSRFFTLGRDPDGTPCDRVSHLSNIEYFAANHFQIAARRAEVMDPQQRLLLETTWEALQDAGLGPDDYDRQRSAIYVGVSSSEYNHLVSARLRERQMVAGQFGKSHDQVSRTQRVAPIRAYTLPGCMHCMTASVVTQFFNWGGPAYSVDGACASSLLAVDQACHYLQRQAPDQAAPIAVAAGVFLNLVPDMLVGFSRIGALATRPSSAFDVSANGFTLGEGLGVVVLKRLDQAVRDGDRIYSVIRHTVCNSDGETPNPMTPNLESQKRLLHEGLAACGLGPQDLGYLECHGTGTPVGDRTELQAWHDTLGASGHRPWIGSVKSNLGHTLPAAGVAGVIRAALALYHKTIPVHAGWTRWPDYLEPLAAGFRVPQEPQPWEHEPRRASVTAFAFGGINCMAVLEEAPAPPTPPEPRPLAFVVSAPNRTLLGQFSRRLAETLRSHPQPLAWVAHTLNGVRNWGEARRSFQAASHEELLQGLESEVDLGLEELPQLATHERRQADLPPTPLERTPFWVISALSPQPKDSQREGQVREWLVRTCGCSPADLKPELHLIRDLGLDSLAMRELLSLLPPGSEELLACTEWTVGELLGQCRKQEQAYRGGRLSARTHPFLLDHSLERTMLLPLASGLDFMAWSQNLQAPWTLAGLEVQRGVLFRQETEIALEREGEEIRLLELRGSRRVVALKATLRELEPSPIAFDIEPEWQLEEGELARFYSEVTFHGSRLEGIHSVLRVGPQGIVGRVRTSIPRDWIPGDPRSQWHLDPLVIDGCLQLALLGIHRVHGRGALPSRIEEVTLLSQFTTGLLEARVRSLGVNDEGPRADIQLYQNGRLVAWMRGLQSRWVQHLPARSWESIPEDWKRVDQLPEVVAHQQALGQLSDRNPYFQVSPPEVLNFCHYNYVGLGRHPRVLESAQKALFDHGCSARASRLVGGEVGLHGQLEQSLAQFLGHEAGLLMVGGHATNVSLLSFWMQGPDLILHDSLSHNSILEGAQASQARRLSFPHNDTVALERLLIKIRNRFRRVLIVVEGIYSMDGDIAPLPELVRIKEKYGCMLMVDEAHSLGVLGATGRGICEHFGVDPKRVEVLMGTLSKTLGSCGGYLVGCRALVDYLRYSLPGFIYSVGLSPPLTGAALTALEVLREEPQRVDHLRRLSRHFWEGCRKLGLPLGNSQATPVVPLILGNSMACFQLCAALERFSIVVKPIVYPAVEEEAARVRFFINHDHRLEDLDRTLKAIEQITAGAEVNA